MSEKYKPHPLHMSKQARSKASLRKHSITLHGHATSFSLEDAFYEIIVESAAQRGQSLASLIAMIDDERDRESNLSSSLRLYALDWVLSKDTAFRS